MWTDAEAVESGRGWVLAGKLVDGPLTAWSQADVIQKRTWPCVSPVVNVLLGWALTRLANR